MSDSRSTSFYLTEENADFVEDKDNRSQFINDLLDRARESHENIDDIWTDLKIDELLMDAELDEHRAEKKRELAQELEEQKTPEEKALERRLQDAIDALSPDAAVLDMTTVEEAVPDTNSQQIQYWAAEVGMDEAELRDHVVTELQSRHG